MNFFCFIHIEKAGGITLHHLLWHNISNYVNLKPIYFWSNEKDCYFKNSELDLLLKYKKKVSGIGGHTVRSYAGYEIIIRGQINYFTFIRNPEYRYLSHYFHQLDKMGIKRTIIEYLNEPRFNNYMTVRIAGEENFDKAIEELEKKFTFVGLVEDFNQSVLLLNKLVFMGKLNPLYEKKNVTINNSREKILQLHEKYSEKIIENNWLDIKLYRYVKNNLFPTYLTKYENLENDLCIFEQDLKSFSYKKINKIIRIINKHYTRRFVESKIYQLEKTVDE